MVYVKDTALLVNASASHAIYKKITLHTLLRLQSNVNEKYISNTLTAHQT